LPTNSPHGTIPGLFVLLSTLIRLVFIRLFTGIKIVHIHGASGKSWIRKSFIIKLAKALGFKVIWHCHACQMKEYTISHGLNKIRRVLVKCDNIVVLSQSWYDYFRETYKLDNVTIINNIVSKPDKVSNKFDGVVKLLFLGQIGQRKGCYDMLEAIKAAKDTFAGKLKLYVGGNGEVEKFTSLIHDYGCDDIIEYVGWVNGEKKQHLLNECNIIILPSYNEGLPISILEGMAHAMPIISTTVGGIPEIVKNDFNGILIKAGDVQQLTQAIQHYVDQPHLIEAEGRNSLSIVKEFYPQSVYDQLASLYNNMLITQK
jgi:glycosyltransferase involved in cell wall biosynthesis